MDSDKKVFDITVNKSASPKVEDTPKAATESTFKVPVRNNMSSAPEEAAPEEPTEDVAIRHKVVIAPISDMKAAPKIDEKAAPVEEPTNIEEVKEVADEASEAPVEVEKETNEVEPEKKVTEEEPTEKDDEPAPEVAETEVVATEVKPTDAVKQEEETQSPTVFDTKQYHLPIREGKSHNSGKHMLVFVVVFLVIIAVGVLVAADAGLLDLGFKLPFDLIK